MWVTSCPFVDNLILRLSSYSSPVPMKWEEERAWKQVGKMICNIRMSRDIRSKYITIHKAKQFCMEIIFKKRYCFTMHTHYLLKVLKCVVLFVVLKMTCFVFNTVSIGRVDLVSFCLLQK